MAANTLCSITAPVAASVVARKQSSSIAAPKAPLKVSTASRAISLVCEARNNGASSSAFEAAKEACRNIEVPAAFKPALITAVANAVASSPAHAGVLFDFNFTLPIICGQFLILMVILDKVVFDPVGKTLMSRDDYVNAAKAQTSDGGDGAEQMLKEAEEMVAKTKAEIAADLQKQEDDKQAELDEEFAAEEKKLEEEFQEAMAALKAQEVESREAMKDQIDVVAEAIANKVLSQGDIVLDKDNKQVSAASVSA